MATATARLVRPRMNLWRLEWLRLIRTPRALALGAVFVFFGLLEPVLTRYQSQIFRHVGNGVRISFPPATPAAGVSGYIGELSGTGLIDAGELEIPIAATFPLAQVRDAFRLLASGHTHGKIVLLP